MSNYPVQVRTAIGLLFDIAQWYERNSSLQNANILELAQLFDSLALLSLDSSDDWVSRIIACDEWPTLAPAVSLARARYEFVRECRQAETILADRSAFDFGEYLKCTYAGSAIFSPEFLAATGELKTALVVGSGPMPDTAAMLAIFCQLQVTCLDINPVYESLSRRILSRGGLRESIDHVCADGSTFADYGNYDLVFVNALALTAGKNTQDPKRVLASAIASSARRGTVVAFREGYGIGRLYYPSAENAGQYLKRLGSIFPSMPGRGAIALFEARSPSEL